LALALLAPLAGCVKKSTHEVALADLAGARAEGESLRDQVARQETREAELEAELVELGRREERLDSRIEALEREVRTLEDLRAEAVTAKLCGSSSPRFGPLKRRSATGIGSTKTSSGASAP
jgi:hypothetical protein